MKRQFSSVCAIALCGALATPAYALDNADVSEQSGSVSGNAKTENVGQNEIVVTALKGNMTAQQAPTTVVIVSGEEIERRSIASIDQLQTVVPGIRFQQSPDGSINPVVRGLGTSSTNPAFEQSIGLFIDGAYSGHSIEYSSALFDIDRVELLKGTQASVVGKGTSLGALSLVLNKPEIGEFGYSLTGSHEFALGGDTLTGMINIPAGDKLALRWAGIYSDEGGWIKSAFGQASAPSKERIGLRFSARWQPDDALDWTVSAQYSEMDQLGSIFHVGIDRGGQYAVIAASLGDPDFVPERYVSRSTPRPGYSRFGLSEQGSSYAGTRLNSILNYDLGPATITSTTSYSEFEYAYLADAYGLKTSPLYLGGTDDSKSFSQELRVSSNSDSRFSYILGAYYYNDNRAIIGSFDYLSVLGTVGYAENLYDQKIDAVSGFGQLGYEITDAFHVQGSLRYEHIKKEAIYERNADAAALGPNGVSNPVTGGYPLYSPMPVTLGDSEGNLTGSVQAQYFFNPRTQVYASFGTGVKAFGYLTVVKYPTVPGTADYKTEKARTWEAGAKIDLGGSSHLNVAAFYTLVDDYQVGVNLGAAAGFIVTNYDLKIPGAEAELVWNVAPGLTLSGSVTYADAKKRGTVPASQIKGAPYSPKWSGLAKFDYSMPLNERYDFNLGGKMEFRSSQVLHDSTFLAYNLFGKQPGYAKFGGYIGVDDVDNGISVALSAENLFNKFNYTNMYAAGVQAAAVAEDRPRTVMLQISIKR